MNRSESFLFLGRALTLLVVLTGLLEAQVPVRPKPAVPVKLPVSGAQFSGVAGDQDSPEEGSKIYPYQQLPPSLELPKVLPYSSDAGARNEVQAGSAADENRALDTEIRALKANEKGPRRFAQDLFDLRQYASFGTEGGIPDAYILGTGDVLQLYSFGGLPFEAPLRVDGLGEVVIPRVGKVKVAGSSLGQAKQKVQALLTRRSAGTQAEVQVLKLREVRIFVYGEVYKPGAFLVPSLSSVVNLLSLSGGPTRLGSYREIRLIRAGQVVQTFDLYPLRAFGQGYFNQALQNGDTLFVPLRKNNILMKGAFLRLTATPTEALDPEKLKNRKGLLSPAVPDPGDPLLVELKDRETAWEAVQFMGGVPPMPVAPRITLERTDSRGLTSILNLTPDEAILRATPIFGDDILTALQGFTTPEGILEVAGYARVPGRFAWKSGLTLRGFLHDQNQLLPDTYLGRVEVLRTHPDGRQELLTRDLGLAMKGDPAQDLPLSARDVLTLFPKDQLRPKATVTLAGPFAKAGSFPWFQGMRAADLIFRAGLPDPGANRFYAELAHFRNGERTAVISLDLNRLLSTEEASPASLQDDQANPLVEPFDAITVYERPDFRLHHQVMVQGQVSRPGPYTLDKDHTTLREVLKRAGGLTMDAMPRGAIFLRRAGSSSKDIQEGLKGSQIRQKDPTGLGVMEILDRLSETTRQPSTGQLLKSPILHGLEEGSLTRLVIDFEKLLHGDSAQDIELQDGDQILIPKKTDTAYIIGETASPFFAYKIQGGLKVSNLVALAGGFTRNADQSNIRLLKANGQIVDAWVSSQVVEPGDAVLVPQRVRRDTTWQENLSALTPLALILNAIK
jgi:protein involved in polysaccharide export with SLBB domain